MKQNIVTAAPREPSLDSASVRDAVKRCIRRLPYLRGLFHEISRLRTELQRYRTWAPPGHFYSPIPDLEDLTRRRTILENQTLVSLGDIELFEDAQLTLLQEFALFYKELPFQAHRSPTLRYFYENNYYSYCDAIVLYSMIRHVKPSRIIEVGSGFSSALMLDTNELFFDGNIECTFIDPDPARLRSLLKERDELSAQIVPHRVQEVPWELFSQLEANDIFFVDTSHVCKTGSDVNWIVFEIIPRLPPGVYVHFHDIFYPFEYPWEWVHTGVAWNESYLLRGFLQYNQAFRIYFFTAFLLGKHRSAFERALPLALRSEKEALTLDDAPGSSLWLVREPTNC